VNLGKAARKGFRMWRNRRRKKKGLPPKEERPMLKHMGWVTNSGLLTIAIGLLMNLFGVGDCIPNAEGVCENADAIATQLSAALDQIFIGLGTVVGTVGRVRTARKLAKLSG
jgi:hypothetical protein